MSAAFFVDSNEIRERNDGRPLIFEGYELGKAILEFIKATEESEAAEIRWSS